MRAGWKLPGWNRSGWNAKISYGLENSSWKLPGWNIPRIHRS
jgi:hypothetical protein